MSDPIKELQAKECFGCGEDFGKRTYVGRGNNLYCSEGCRTSIEEYGHPSQLVGELAKSFTTLPGNYAYHERLGNHELTYTFQTLEEMKQFIAEDQGPKK